MVSVLWQEAHGPFGEAALGASMVEGPDRHHGPAKETTMDAWRAHGVSGLQGRGREGTVRIDSDGLLSNMFIFGGRRGR
jgi:hypothetical protein